ncbi:MAG: DUF4307 domain-containing protein [Nocardioides sp.]
MTTPDALSDRYGAAQPWRRRAVLLGSVVLAVAFLAWLGWSAFARSTPQVTSSLLTWEVVDPHSATAQIAVRISDRAADPTCTLQAYAADHTLVGEQQFTPVDGTNNRTLRTERAATSVQLLGCTTPDQHAPR